MAEKTILKCARKMDDSLNLAVMKLAELPLVAVFESQLVHIKELNLARNKLFNGDVLFEVTNGCLSVHTHRRFLTNCAFYVKS